MICFLAPVVIPSIICLYYTVKGEKFLKVGGTHLLVTLQIGVLKDVRVCYLP